MLYDFNEQIQAPRFVFPLGGWRGGDRAIAVGGVGGVLGIGARVESFLHYYNVLARFWTSNHATNFEPYDIKNYSDTLRLTKLPVGQFGIFFLRCLTHRISQAKPKNSPSVPPFGRLRLLREGVAGERTAGEKAKQKTRVAGHRTMRQGSKLALFAANLRHGRKVRPCPRPLGAQGGDVFGCSGGKREQEKRPPLVISFLVGSPCWTRTSDTLINSQVLYRLS